ncbi:MAG: hypothetical protein AB7T06_40315 [Kofleriaceae bacterium]
MRSFLSVALATMLWVSTLSYWFERSPEALAAPLARQQLALWDPANEPMLAAKLGQLRQSNPEWDLMARMFAALAFANLALSQPQGRAEYVAAIDRIIERTLRDVERGGTHEFLLPYGRARPFLDDAQTSIFIEGELALMLAVRQLVEPDPHGAEVAREWVGRAIDHLERSPVLLAESYPDEVWIFCNTVALAAIRIFDVVEDAPERHAELLARWVASARSRIVDPATGLLGSKTTRDGVVLEGPEGSTLWIAATMLRVIDDDFAREQYHAARAHLRGSLAGFGWAREWPDSWQGADDVDSGPTIPIVGANAGSSGLALVAARAFHDESFTQELIVSLNFAGFPVDDGARFAAGNPLADSAILFALTSGPLWTRVGVGGAR